MGEHDHNIVIVEEGQGNVILRYFTLFLKKFITVSSIYLFGFYDLSVGWLVAPIILSICRQEWNRRKELKREAVRMLMKNEKKVILSVLGKDLPSWVFFPDVDRAEWLNKMLQQLWPNVTTYAHDMIRTTVQAKIKETLENYGMKGFEFVKLRLGTMPPRIGGIKVYERNHSRSEIMIDVDLIYSGDCDISFTLKGLSGGIKDFQIHGMMRVILKPLIPSIPFVGGVQIFFLNKPDIDFNLVGVADVLDIPGISDVLRKVIVEQISAMMVLPNKLPIVLSEAVPAQVVKTPEPAGVIRVHVVKAIQLMKKDVGVLGKGKSDPYIIVTMGAQEFRSKTIDNTTEPKWDFWCEGLLSFPGYESLIVEVFDEDTKLPGTEGDDFLGRATFKVDDVFVKGNMEKWLTLEGVKHGMVYLRLSYYELSTSMNDLNAAIEEFSVLHQSGISSALLIFYLDSIHNLPDAKPNKRPDPVVSITAGRSTKVTGVQFRSSSPVYEQGFTFLIHNPKNESLTMKITDQKTGIELGSMHYSLSLLLDADDFMRDLEPSPLSKAGSNCKVVFSAQLKVLKKVVGIEPDMNTKAINPTVSTITPPSTPSVTSAASTEVMLQNGGTETSTPKSNDETSRDVQSISNEDNLDTSAQSLDSLNVSGSDVDADSYKVEKVKSSYPLLQATPNISNSAVSKQKSFSGSIKSSLRKRQASQAESVKSLGSVELTLSYVKERQRLLVHVHRATDLFVKDPTDLPDPYVKVYLLPKSEDNKRKTKVVKDSANPIYEEYFEYVVSDDEINDKKLHVSVVSHKTAFYGHNSVLGQATLTLSELNLNNYRAWYQLEPNGD